jgi:type III secretory pathway component EscS
LRFRTPTTRFLGRARLVFTLAELVPTILMSALGIVLLAAGPSPSVAAVAGTLVTIVEDAMVFA